jgi:hypothetical protein
MMHTPLVAIRSSTYFCMAHYYIPTYSNADTLGVGYKSFNGGITIAHYDASTEYFGPNAPPGVQQNVVNATVPFLAASLDDYPLPTEAAENPPINIKFLAGIWVSALGQGCFQYLTRDSPPVATGPDSL